MEISKPLARSLHARWVRWPVFSLVALLAFLVRMPQLGARPMHTDEAVNAYILGQMLSGHSYLYDPQDRHGPALTALALPLVRLQGVHSFAQLTEPQLRLTTVLAGTVTVLLFGAAAQIFGFTPCLIAALLFAFSPLPVYYDRYFIHESLFVAAGFGLIVSAWRAGRTHSTAQAVLTGLCAALVLVSKETAVLQLFSLAGAAAVLWFWSRRTQPLAPPWRPRAFLAAAAVFLLVSVALFTWFGRNWSALPALLRAVPHLWARAGGEGHQKPVWYYAQLLTSGWSGGLVCALDLIGFIQTLRRRASSPYSFLALYACLLAAVYSLIPYKTPWLALNFWLPISLFAGLAIQSLWCAFARPPALRIALRVLCILLIAAASFTIAHDTRERVFRHPAGETNPYAYAQTTDDLLSVPDEIALLARQSALSSPRIAVIAADPWPLPWYLRHYANVGFWQPGQPLPPADFYITSTEAADRYASQLKGFLPEFYGVRPGVFVLLWSPASK